MGRLWSRGDQCTGRCRLPCPAHRVPALKRGAVDPLFSAMPRVSAATARATGLLCDAFFGSGTMAGSGQSRFARQVPGGRQARATTAATRCWLWCDHTTLSPVETTWMKHGPHLDEEEPPEIVCRKSQVTLSEARASIGLVRSSDVDVGTTAHPLPVLVTCDARPTQDVFHSSDAAVHAYGSLSTDT